MSNVLLCKCIQPEGHWQPLACTTSGGLLLAKHCIASEPKIESVDRSTVCNLELDSNGAKNVCMCDMRMTHRITSARWTAVNCQPMQHVAARSRLHELQLHELQLHSTYCCRGAMLFVAQGMAAYRVQASSTSTASKWKDNKCRACPPSSSPDHAVVEHPSQPNAGSL